MAGGKHSSPAPGAPACAGCAPGAPACAGCAPGASAHFGGGAPCAGPGAATTAATAGRAGRAATGCATGCAVVLELARAFASMKERPPHPVIFAAVTAEEKGLLGSKHLGEHPPIPASQIGLNLNFDSFAPLGVPESVKMLGAERTSFNPAVERTAKAFRLAIEADSRPLAGSYYRSDHFSMARVGVPAFSVSLGDKFAGQTREWGQEKSREYTARNYHQPSDEYRDDMDFASSVEIARFGFALGWQALNAAAPIAWLPGDEFEAARLKSERNP